jgi:NTE family protein
VIALTDKEIHDFLAAGMHGDEESKNTVDEIASKDISPKSAGTANVTSSIPSGLVLDGGGGKGAYQLGVLKALTENHLLDNVTAVSGSSIGAINSVLYAMEDIGLMYKAWSDIDMLTLFDVDLSMLTENRIYFSRQEMLKLLDKYIDFNKIRKSKMDIYSTICRVDGEKKTVEYRKLNDCDDARIKDILLASSALPVIYEPVTIDGNEYIDGGVVDNEPVKPLYDKGIRRFIIIGMKQGKVFDASKWPDAEFITIYPSADIGDFMDGTIDFTGKSVEFREMLGYKDGLRAIKTKFEKNDMYINLERVLAQNDLNEIKMQLRTNTAAKVLGASINSNIDKFNEIANKYDF